MREGVNVSETKGVSFKSLGDLNPPPPSPPVHGLRQGLAGGWPCNHYHVTPCEICSALGRRRPPNIRPKSSRVDGSPALGEPG